MSELKLNGKQWLELLISLPFIVAGSVLINSSPTISILLFILGLVPFIGIKFADWIVKTSKYNRLTTVLLWLNTISWIIPVVGFFTSAFSLRYFQKASNSDKKFALLGTIGLVLSLANSILGAAMGYARGLGNSLDFVPMLLIVLALGSVVMMFCLLALFRYPFKENVQRNNNTKNDRKDYSNRKMIGVDNLLKVVIIIAIIIGIGVLTYRFINNNTDGGSQLQVGETFKLKDGLELYVKEVEIVDYFAKDYSDNILFDDMVDHRLVTLSVQSNSKIPRDTFDESRLVRENGTLVKTYNTGYLPDHGSYSFEFEIESMQTYYWLFGDGTQVRLFPYSY
jgi:hypothetical protein